MKNKISVIKGADDTMSCNACFARNFESQYKCGDDRIVEEIFEVRVGHTVHRLCKDCLKELGKSIMEVM